MRGNILIFDTENDHGIISGEDGKRYFFSSLDWSDPDVFPKPKLLVDFELQENNAVSIYVISTPIENNKFNNTANRNSCPSLQLIDCKYLAFVGVALLILGLFAPFISVPILGNLNYLQTTQIASFLIITFAIFSFFFAFLEKYEFIWLTSSGSLLVLICTFIIFYLKINEAKNELNLELNDTPFSGMAQAAVATVHLQWGFIILLLGTTLLFLSALQSKQTLTWNKIINSAKKIKTINWVLIGIAIFTFILILSYQNIRKQSQLEVSTNESIESTAETILGSINEYQQDFYVENNFFSSNLNELKPLLDNNKYYKISEIFIDPMTEFVSVILEPKKKKLNSFSSAVYFDKNNDLFNSKICKTERKDQIINFPELFGDRIICPPGSIEID